MKVLQTSALPLGYRAAPCLSGFAVLILALLEDLSFRAKS